jgi:hypothetical protein
VFLPRYFTPRSGAESHPASPGVVHALDVFILHYGSTAVEWIVGLDRGGNLGAQRLDPFDALPANLRSQIAFHEVSGGARRVMGLDGLFLFEMRLLEQAPDCPGVNDPVYLYGSLVGPLHARSVDGAPPIHRTEGQLTVTRGDLLAGLVAGAGWSFHCPDGNRGKMARTLSLLTGADLIDTVRAGHGAVLIYPLLGVDADVYSMAPGNEEIVSRILYDLLFAWWKDVARESPPAHRDAEGLPVPSRPQHERQLVRQGFEIKRDMAVRPKDGWAGALPGSLGEDRRRLPMEGDTDDFLDLAAEALARSSDWPSPSVLALHQAVRGPSGRWGLRQLDDHVKQQLPDSSGNPIPAWVQNFLAAHGQNPQPHLTPGPDDPTLPRSLAPLDPSAADKAAEVMRRLEAKFDRR